MGSQIYQQRGFAASDNSSAFVCFHKSLSPFSTLNAGVGYFLWSHKSLKHRWVERQQSNHLPFTIYGDLSNEETVDVKEELDEIDKKFDEARGAELKYN
jgi:hypothetical protein